MMAFQDMAIFIASKWIENIISFNRINSRLLNIQILINKCIANIFIDYAPQNDRPLGEKDLFYGLMP